MYLLTFDLKTCVFSICIICFEIRECKSLAEEKKREIGPLINFSESAIDNEGLIWHSDLVPIPSDFSKHTPRLSEFGGFKWPLNKTQ